MSDQDVFKEQETTPTANPLDDQTGGNDVATKLASITREDGTPKYESVDKALESLVASQAHIKKLEDEAKEKEAKLAELSKKAEEAASYEEVLAKLQDSQENPTKETPTDGGLNEEVASKLVEKVLYEKEVKATQQENFQSVNKALLEKYGTEANKEVKKKADELGITVNDMVALAHKSPAAVLAYFGSTPSVPAMTTPSTSVDLTTPKNEEAPSKTKGLLGGIDATDANVKAAFKRIQEEVYERHGIQT